MKTPTCLLLSLALAGLLARASGQSNPPPAPRPLPPESRQFDFWIGEWDVVDAEGKPAGSSVIESIAGGAGLLENWTGAPVAGGGTGKSLNAYNLEKKQWQQFWVGSGGGILELAGALAGDSMVLSGEHVVRGRHLFERITWTPLPEGTVRQLWEQSADGGQTWQVIFEGIYRRKLPG
jgi:hypothetical protein